MTETLREKFMKKIVENPRFKEAEKSGKAFVIVGARQRYSKAEREIITHLQRGPMIKLAGEGSEG